MSSHLRLARVLGVSSRAGHCVVPGSDGHTFVVAGARFVWLFNERTGHQQTLAHDHDDSDEASALQGGAVVALATSLGGDLIAAATESGATRSIFLTVWSATTLQRLARIDCGALRGRIRSVGFAGGAGAPYLWATTYGGGGTVRTWAWREHGQHGESEASAVAHIHSVVPGGAGRELNCVSSDAAGEELVACGSAFLVYIALPPPPQSQQQHATTSPVSPAPPKAPYKSPRAGHIDGPAAASKPASPMRRRGVATDVDDADEAVEGGAMVRKARFPPRGTPGALRPLCSLAFGGEARLTFAGGLDGTVLVLAAQRVVAACAAHRGRVGQIAWCAGAAAAVGGCGGGGGRDSGGRDSGGRDSGGRDSDGALITLGDDGLLRLWSLVAPEEATSDSSCTSAASDATTAVATPTKGGMFGRASAPSSSASAASMHALPMRPPRLLTEWWTHGGGGVGGGLKGVGVLGMTCSVVSHVVSPIGVGRVFDGASQPPRLRLVLSCDDAKLSRVEVAMEHSSVAVGIASSGRSPSTPRAAVTTSPGGISVAGSAAGKASVAAVTATAALPPPRVLMQGHATPAQLLLAHPRSQQVLAIDRATACLWELRTTAAPLWRVQLPAAARMPCAAAFAPSGRLWALGGDGGTTVIFDGDTPICSLRPPPRAPRAPPRSPSRPSSPRTPLSTPPPQQRSSPPSPHRPTPSSPSTPPSTPQRPRMPGSPSPLLTPPPIRSAPMSAPASPRTPTSPSSPSSPPSPSSPSSPQTARTPRTPTSMLNGGGSGGSGSVSGGGGAVRALAFAANETVVAVVSNDGAVATYEVRHAADRAEVVATELGASGVAYLQGAGVSVASSTSTAAATAAAVASTIKTLLWAPNGEHLIILGSRGVLHSLAVEPASLALSVEDLATTDEATQRAFLTAVERGRLGSLAVQRPPRPAGSREPPSPPVCWSVGESYFVTADHQHPCLSVWANVFPHKFTPSSPAIGGEAAFYGLSKAYFSP